MLGGNDIYKIDTEPEQAMRVRIARPFTQKKQLDKALHREAARRVRLLSYQPL